MSPTQGKIRILVVGNGGREHALTWKLAQSPRVEHIYVCPGNGGTDVVIDGKRKVENVDDVKADDFPALVAFCREKAIDLVIPGPEAPLVAGIADVFKSGSETVSYRTDDTTADL
jgi:phosphoribosylamine--glycine ligase/phosphoribosylformylglycinamidine cyclo-ligase